FRALNEKGIIVSKRTVAVYRTDLGIQNYKQRKR
ncbi:hypothetical protein ACFL52_04070, partial [Candidatus Margulisiibacteriota bacterium]